MVLFPYCIANNKEVNIAFGNLGNLQHDRDCSNTILQAVRTTLAAHEFLLNSHSNIVDLTEIRNNDLKGKI